MQELSYPIKNPIFELSKVKFSVTIYTFVNAYTLDDRKIVINKGNDNITIICDRLIWAGGQETASGRVSVKARKTEFGVRISIEAEIHDENEIIRNVKLTIHDIKDGDIVNLIDARQKSIPSEGLILKYPEGWRDVGTPLMILKNADGEYSYYKSLDNRVRTKLFAFTRGFGDLTAELIFEEIATEMMNRVIVPDWEIGTGNSVESIYIPHMKHVEESYMLESWETRLDVPRWARDIALVASIHCQHWTGYIFNDYKSVLINLEKICKKIDGKNVLAYLPGWEGRYYWQYGNYRPDNRMGGEEGFRNLCEGAKQLGVHVMPMFGINVVGKHFNGYEHWGEPSEFRGPSGNRGGGSVDWDASRHYDHGSMRTVNPAAPKWQNRLFSSVTSLMDRFGFDGAFFDISACWRNDPNYYVYDGVKALMKKLKDYNPNMLLAGEGWYDGHSACVPLLQCGHTEGVFHWHDDAYAPFFDKYVRAFGHLCLGDPSRGSTGVHELGFNPIWRCPVRKGIIPTITIVDGTLDNAPDKCDQILEDAKVYLKTFLNDNN